MLEFDLDQCRRGNYFVASQSHGGEPPWEKPGGEPSSRKARKRQGEGPTKIVIYRDRARERLLERQGE